MDPLFWTVLAASAVLAASVAWARHDTRRRLERLLAGMPHAAETVEAVARALDEERAASRYLTQARGRVLQERLGQAQVVLSSALPRLVARLAPTERERLGSLRARHAEVAKRLLEHNAEHLAAERALHDPLLRGSHGLSDEQIEAVLKDDARNLVLAGAGAGKTRVLIARMEYLTRRRAAVAPERILAVTYTRQAAAEIEERLAARGLQGTRASTLHALGRQIVSAARGYVPDVLDEKRLGQIVEHAIGAAKAGTDPVFAGLYLQVLSNYFRSEREDVPQQPPDQLYRTLDGKRVASFGERIIADYLFLHGIGYQHEAVARWAPRTPGKGPYRPDFHLVGHGAYIEHWGVDEHGRVPAWFTWTSEQYREKMAWARQVFAGSGHRLIETYDHERRRGTLERVLEERLRTAGIIPQPIGLDRLAKSVRDFSDIDRDLARMLSAFIANARALRLRSADIPPRLTGRTPRVVAFGRCAAEILRRYEQVLDEEKAIDFSDMLHEAADALQSGKAGPEFRFEHVLVDEFQDLSPDKARLVAALVPHDGKLFAVGDDYQGIFAFSGGDIGYVVDFERHFGPATTTLLRTNYRSPPLIVEAGKAVIEHNPRQIRKALRAASEKEAEALVHTVAPDREAVLAKTMQIIEAEAKRVGSLRDILVVSRVNWPFDHLRTLCWRRRIRVEGDDGVRLLSAHRSKGSEAEVVIVMDASEDLYGFPPQVEDRDVLEPVRLGGEDPLAEERRLFYVAITRAMARLHLVVRDGRRSRFLDEIEGERAPASILVEGLRAGQRVSGVLRVARLYALTPRQTQTRMFQTGLLDTGREGIKFASWSRKDPPRVEAGRTYRFEGLLVTEYEGKPQLEIDGNTRAVETVDAKAEGEDPDARPLRVRRVES